MRAIPTKLAALVLVSLFGLGMFSQTAMAFSLFPPGDPVYYFDYTVNASTTLKTLNQTITVPPGRFAGGIDFGTGQLIGAIALPPASFTFRIAGIVPLVTATAKISETKAVTGTVDFSSTPFEVTATATFNISIVNAHATGTTTNLVGNSCTTATPVTVTMSGPANIGAASTFTGTYTLPKLKTCGLATTALNLVLPGPGNTFTALATPQ